MLKHTICHIELSCIDLDRTMLFYRTLFNWTIDQVQPNLALFRSPDGVSGAFRCGSAAPSLEAPMLRIEVTDYAPFIDQSTRLCGGYVGCVDPIQGDWTVNLRDPDGHLIRLSRTAVDASPPPMQAFKLEATETGPSAAAPEIREAPPLAAVQSAGRAVRAKPAEAAKNGKSSATAASHAKGTGAAGGDEQANPGHPSEEDNGR